MRRIALAVVAVLAVAAAMSAETTPTKAPAATAPSQGSPAAPAPPVTAAPTVPIHPTRGTGPNGSHLTTGSYAVALTFDDGPDPVNTPRLLDVLSDAGVHATFCVNGDKVQRYPEVVRRIHAEGHALCNHSWRHIRQLGTYGQPRIRRDLLDTNNAIRAVVPDAAVSYFRAPGGAWTDDYVTVAAELGMVSIHWDVDPSDWQSEVYGRGPAMVNHIIDVLRSEVRPGSIVLSHDHWKPDTTEAYRRLLPWLKEHFTLVALPPGGLWFTQPGPRIDWPGPR
ncbi:MAG TPA: polysaccharide deacetylase family protein [Micromonosporaceae bacterium]|nr:polysaccharide deacetylase family protein [Micromonosporaceae bacterium]